MTEAELAKDDEEVAQMALRALSEAQQRALKSGRVVVFVRDGELIQTGPEGTVVLKQLSPRIKVDTRVKRARQ